MVEIGNEVSQHRNSGHIVRRRAVDQLSQSRSLDENVSDLGSIQFCTGVENASEGKGAGPLTVEPFLELSLGMVTNTLFQIQILSAGFAVATPCSTTGPLRGRTQ